MMIGIFKREANGYTGRLFSREWRDLSVTILPTLTKTGASPDYVVTGRARRDEFELGAGWQRTSGKGNPYLSIKLDAPTLPEPVHAALIEQLNGSFGLVWNRDVRDQKDKESAAA